MKLETLKVLLSKVHRIKPKKRWVKSKTVLNQIRDYDLEAAFFLHQIHAPCVSDIVNSEIVGAAEGFAIQLEKKTDWKLEASFKEWSEINASPYSEKHRLHKLVNDGLGPGLCWRLFVVSIFVDLWKQPPTLSEYRHDIEVVQQAALYHPGILNEVIGLVSAKYGNKLFIVSEHYTSWTQLSPDILHCWEKYLIPDNVRNGAKQLRRHCHMVDMLCVHMLYEIQQQFNVPNKGRFGLPLLAKIVEECRNEWLFKDKREILGKKVFPYFYRFVLACLEGVDSTFVENENTKKNVKAYVKIFDTEDKEPFKTDYDSPPPGAKKVDMVRGHNRTYYGHNREAVMPKLRIRLKGLFNVWRGYPATLNNHDRML